ncbi:MAG TPA: class E sortase [Stackebrandtia sp.]|jgi:sortase A|uniref:class E sortase n=1 Tax=Stackebrandtia sp. TaxID=2023065 RepID=UPI002D6A8A3E|nr:class E sortase [Stackebrandtia sp.]HZE41631.1 class E sortase [Stackebrandtia sp.]
MRHYSDGDEDDERPARGRASIPDPRRRRDPRRQPPPNPHEEDTGDTTSADPLGLIPGPDETTILPRVPSDRERRPAPANVPKTRSRRPVRRHRDGSVSSKGRKVRVVGEIFLTVGMILMLFVAYEIWGKTAEINNAQQEKSDEFDHALANGKDPALDPVPGDAVARLYIPQIRPNPWVVVEGTTPEDIKTAPGHYTQTVMPGKKGNFSVAGHNVPAIFRHIDVLKPGDAIVVETQSKFYIYKIYKHDIVKPTDLDVVDPVPNEPGVKPTDHDRWMTMTTCYPWWDNYKRYIVWAKLDHSQKRGDKLPPETKA